ncbi:hypothetical protein KM043_004269 [Ampulex compressa]|nr:hypothetical protein KM043_004269 [Ampulex compressa]
MDGGLKMEDIQGGRIVFVEMDLNRIRMYVLGYDTSKPLFGTLRINYLCTRFRPVVGLSSLNNTMDTLPKTLPSISGFYADQSILITGCTGFLGKLLIEKLLRSCPDVREIFLLMRPKKGLTIEERLKKIVSLPLFELVRSTNPSIMEKLVPVQADIMTEGLGLGPMERQILINRVSLIFHVAANVRFDDKLKDAVFTNTRSTRDICILAGGMKNLKALVHVSSTYAHAEKPVVEEITYPFEVDWKNTIKIAETVDEDVLQIFTAKYLGTMPNTYTFTKRLAEQVIMDYSHALPCVIFRPSIVISTVEEPVPGWIDNFNGPVSLMILGGKGILRVSYSDPNVILDYMPADIAIKTMLVATVVRGIKTITQNPNVEVFNCSAWNTRCLSTGEVIAMALRCRTEIPVEPVWTSSTIITKSWFVFNVLTFLCHLLPAVLVDTTLKLSGRKPILMKVYRAIYTSHYALSYFVHREWLFKNYRLLGLKERLSEADKKDFDYEYVTFDVHKYFKFCLIGAKKYLLHEDMDQLERTKMRYNRLVWIERILKLWIACFCLWLAYSTNVLSPMFQSL